VPSVGFSLATPKIASCARNKAAAGRAIRPGELTLGTDNGTALTARAFRARQARV
jgi:hypothetical protein